MAEQRSARRRNERHKGIATGLREQAACVALRSLRPAESAPKAMPAWRSGDGARGVRSLPRLRSLPAPPRVAERPPFRIPPAGLAKHIAL